MRFSRARVPAWAGDVLAAVVVIVTALVPGPRPPMPHMVLSLLVPMATVVAVLLIPLRRRWPVQVLVASLLLYYATALVGNPSTGIGIVAIVAAHSTGARTTRVLTLIAGAAATASVALLSITVSTFGVVDPRVFQVAAALAVAAALGDSSRSHREFVSAATERAERAEQTREAEAQRRVAEERLRIAQDLHDTVAHRISVISLNAGAASSALDKNPERVRASLGNIRASARGALTDIGDLLRYLRTDDAATEPPQPGLDDLDALVDRVREGGLEVEMTREGDLDRIVGAPELVVYRIVQEGLTNAHKHGSGRRCEVHISVEGETATVTVSNPISYVERNQSDPSVGGLGLTGIRERVASVRGTVTTDSEGGRFTLRARLPLRGKDRL